MLKIFLQYFTMCCGCHYIYSKLLNRKNTLKLSFLWYVTFCVFIAFLIDKTPAIYTFYGPPLYLLFHFFYLLYVSEDAPKITLFAFALAYSIYYCLYVICVFTLGIVYGFWCTYIYKLELNYNDWCVTIVLNAFLTYLAAFSLFRIRRLRNGMPFLKNQLVSYGGIVIGLVVLLLNMFFCTMSEPTPMWTETMAVGLGSFTALLFVYLFLWWRTSLKTSYLNVLAQKNYQALQDQLTESTTKADTLSQEVQQLTQLMDENKQYISAMEAAINQAFQSLSSREQYQQIRHCQLHKLEEDMNRRNGFLLSYSQNNSHIPATGILSFDHLLSYLLQRCKQQRVSFDVSFCENLSGITAILDEKDFTTLLADLLENALIATKYNHGSHLFLWIRMQENRYYVDVYDDGIPFELKTLLALGKEPCTTHKEDGGSGIGFMNTYALLRQCHGSLYIDETCQEYELYTKKVSVGFDGRGQYHVKTCRPDFQLQQLALRADLILDSS